VVFAIGYFRFIRDKNSYTLPKTTNAGCGNLATDVSFTPSSALYQGPHPLNKRSFQYYTTCGGKSRFPIQML